MISAEKVSINARIVEHPWVFMNLGLEGGRILDVGCCSSSLSIELASLGYPVWGIDVRPYGLTHPNFTFVHEDICRCSLPDGSFDRVLAISTIEHIGVGHYGDPSGQGMDVKALAAVHRLLKPGGRLLISAPFGRRQVNAFGRVYDSEQFRDLLQAFKIIKIEWHVARAGSWLRTTEIEAARRVPVSAIDTDGNVIALAEKR
jgi:SAM-dependent methyltransferase